MTITLTDAQVARVVSDASGGSQLAGLLSGVSDLEGLRKSMEPMWSDHQWSRSVLRAVLVLVALPGDGSWGEITDIARMVGLSPSTTHRYIQTWVALGLAEQNPKTRVYRRPPGTGRHPERAGSDAA
ncbi:MAG TPA: helix-turn-helix domain-containing protein [Solirubrobacteraceae bacterium]|nr:helix-turn-helix domain-containing protein [Solirubrobacteraceae bacterium]